MAYVYIFFLQQFQKFIKFPLSESMDSLSLIITLLSKTQGRDKALRLIQYATLNSKSQKGMFQAVYDQIRMTRKILRFLRTFQYIVRIRKQIPELKKLIKNLTSFIPRLFAICQDIFAFLFFLSDHRVCLSELGMISKKQRVKNYPLSMKYYMVQNIFGILKNVFQITVISISQIQRENSLKNEQEMLIKVKGKFMDMIKCLFDVFIALYYWKQMVSHKTASILGIISSLISIGESMKLI